MREYIIDDIQIYNSFDDDEKHYIKIKTDKDNTLEGTIKIVPEIKDIIRCEIIIKNNKNYFRKEQLLLPINIRDQKCRLLKIYDGDNNILKELEFIKYGKNFWKDYILYIDTIKNTENYTDKLKKLYDYIINKNYIYVLIQSLKGILNNHNIIGLTNKQLLHLYEYGEDMYLWDIDMLVSLYEISYFGYNTIIKIAKGLKKSIEDITILMIINIFYNNEHTYILYDYNNWLNELTKNTEIIIDNLSNDAFKNIIEHMIKKKYIIQIEESKLCLYKLYTHELYIAHQLIEIQYEYNTSPLIKKDISLTELKHFLNNDTIEGDVLDEYQKQGIINFFKNKLSVIHGKAGTGKSNLLKRLIKSIEEMEYKLTPLKVYFLTPTAKALQKIKDIMKDIDNKDKYKYSTMAGFNHNKTEELKVNLLNYYNIIIIDETSMIDINTLYDFLRKIENINTTILFLGDYRQLPSIGPGNIIHDMINSPEIPSCELLNPYRYKTQEQLLDIINKISNKEKLTEEIILTSINQFKLIIPNDNNTVENIIKTECKHNDIIITPLNKDIKKYTDIIRDIINPIDLLPVSQNQINEIRYNNHIFRINDKITHTKNNYIKDIYNGTIGKIINIYEKIDYNDDIIINIEIKKDDKKDFIYKFKNENKQDNLINYLEPGYMASIHKTQGQEYENVLILLSPSRMTNNKLLYTAITRAKKKVTIISSLENLNNVIKRTNNRQTLLKLMIKYKYEKQFNLNITTYDYDSYNNNPLFINTNKSSFINTNESLFINTNQSLVKSLFINTNESLFINTKCIKQDLEYEKTHIIYTKQYYIDGIKYYYEKGIKCKNYDLCEAVLSHDHWECHGNYLCMNCGDWFRFGFGWNELEFRMSSEKCPVCFDKNKKQLKFPTNCGHWFCVSCSRNILFVDDTRYHLSSVPYGCAPCPNGCINPVKGKQCYCDEYIKIQDKCEEEYPIQFNKYNDAVRVSINLGETISGSIFGTCTCPLCKKKYERK